MANFDYQHLADLLAHSTMAEEERTVWIKAIPSFSEDILIQLVQVLEKEQADLEVLRNKLIALAKNIA